MIASARTIRTRKERFLEMLPQIRAQARYAFRKELPARRQELIAEVIPNCWIAFDGVHNGAANGNRSATAATAAAAANAR